VIHLIFLNFTNLFKGIFGIMTLNVDELI